MAGDSIIVISQIEKTADRRIKESEKKMSDVIVLEDVTKRYGNEEVVKNASMHVKEGEIYETESCLGEGGEETVGTV